MKNTEPARESAQRTYDRRRARTAAETLANIPPNRWDAVTRQMIITLATIAIPSRIDAALAVFDSVEQQHDMPSPWCGRPSCGSPACVDCSSAGIPAEPARCGSGHLHGAPEAAMACDSLPRAGASHGPRPAPYPSPRPRPDPDPRPRPEPHPSPDPAMIMHDNGDYRA